MGVILDFIFAATVFFAFIIGCHKGFVKSVWKIAALAVTIILVTALKNPAAEFLSSTRFADNVETRLSEKISLPRGGGVDIAESLNLPDFMRGDVNNQIENAQDAVISVNETAVNSLTGLIIKIIACVALFILIRLILAAVYLIINGITRIPVVHGMNKLTGGLLGAVNIIFIVFLLLALVSVFSSADSKLFAAIDNTYIVKYLYNYNILLQLFLKL